MIHMNTLFVEVFFVSIYQISKENIEVRMNFE